MSTVSSVPDALSAQQRFADVLKNLRWKDRSSSLGPIRESLVFANHSCTWRWPKEGPNHVSVCALSIFPACPGLPLRVTTGCVATARDEFNHGSPADEYVRT